MLGQKRRPEVLNARERFSDLFDAAAVGIYEIARDGRVLLANDALARMMGYESADGMTGKNIRQHWVHPEKRHEHLATLDRDDITRGLEIEARRTDGSVFLIEDYGRPIRDPHGNVVGSHGVVIDVTERKRAQAEAEQTGEALRRGEADFRFLFKGNPLPMWVYDLDTLEFLAVNDAAVDHYGYSSEEFLMMKITDIRPPDEVPRLLEELSHNRGSEQDSGVWRHLTKDGRELHVEIRSRVIPFEGRTGVLVVVNDVTEGVHAGRQRELLEARLRQAIKMEAVGRVAGGIAHDFNNLLALISGYASSLKRALGKDHPRAAYVEEITKAGERGTALVRQLTAFAREEPIEPRDLNLNHVVKDMEQVLRRSIGRNITLSIEAADDLWDVRADPTQLERILMNLALNARAAMPDGGELVIETRNFYADAEMAGIHPGMSPGPYALLVVTDSGTGMTEEIRSQVFDPFFTTKPHGEGSGLGLSTVYGSVKQSGGYITVYSEPGFGTAFHLYFPAAAAPTRRSRVNGNGETVRGSGEPICLVDSEEPMRELVQRVLTRAGYRVVAASPGEAPERIEQTHVDLLLTDVVMPETSGKDLAARIAATVGSTKTLFMSRYAKPILVRQGALEGREDFIQKPFTSDQLLSEVGRLLRQ